MVRSAEQGSASSELRLGDYAFYGWGCGVCYVGAPPPYGNAARVAAQRPTLLTTSAVRMFSHPTGQLEGEKHSRGQTATNQKPYLT